MTHRNRPFHFTRRLWLVAGLFIAYILLFALYVWSEKKIDQANELRYQSFLLADELRQSSDDLTRMARTYVVTGNPLYKTYYQHILDIRNGDSPRPVDYHSIYWDLFTASGVPPRPDSGEAIPLLELIRRTGFTDQEMRQLEVAKSYSDALTATEFEAMRLSEATGPKAEPLRAKARSLLHDERYHQAKAAIMAPIAEFQRLMEQRTQATIHEAENLAHVIRAVLIAVGLGLVLMVSITYHLLRKTLGGSVEDVHGLITKLGAGDFSSPLPFTMGRETDTVLGWLSETRATLGRMEQVRKQAEADLHRAKDAAEAANRVKSEFLANMSHEIHTPMNAVLGLAQLLEKEPLTPDQHDMVQRIRASGRSLLGILNDILDFSKIEAGQVTIEPRPFNLLALLDHTTSMTTEMAREKGLELRFEVPAGVAGDLLGDSLRLEQILLNLLGNAIKFTEGGEIVVRVIAQTLTGTTARFRFEVCDTGVGIAPEVLPTLFQPFTQADGSITRRFGGTGLGLSICKRLIELMGGVIGVESQQGVGSVFWFELPFERVTAVAPALEPGAPAVAPGGLRLAGQRILVVDDSDINRALVARALQREGAEAVLAHDGQQAIEALRAAPQPFNAVLMDVQMPVLDGLSATRVIRGELGLTELPVIALTASVLEADRQQALAAGINDFLGKPVDLEAMTERLRRWISGVPKADMDSNKIPVPH